MPIAILIGAILAILVSAGSSLFTWHLAVSSVQSQQASYVAQVQSSAAAGNPQAQAALPYIQQHGAPPQVPQSPVNSTNWPQYAAWGVLGLGVLVVVNKLV